jgi:catechol 2,3-dioxygenase-like lactoylglutathione lyase family enzyme
MEHIISKLLNDFESGKMNRRQLIQSLALAATAAGAASPATAADGHGFKAVTINHISYQVADYAKTRDWYVDVFGMKVSGDNGRQCNLSFGDSFLLPRNARSGVQTPHVDHIAYTIETWDQKAVKAELDRRGLTSREDTVNSYHTKDPYGFDVKISGKEMKALGSARWAVGAL